MVSFFFFFKQKTAYEIYQCDWSSDVCSSDLIIPVLPGRLNIGKLALTLVQITKSLICNFMI